MPKIMRYSPVKFDSIPTREVVRGGWQISLDFKEQGQGLYLVDLSHLPRWDIQDKDLSGIKPFGLDIPEKPNMVVRKGERLISRLNHTQCQIWSLDGDNAQPPDGASITEITDGQAVLALIGRDLSEVVETITSVDIFGPAAETPCLFQAPVLQIPCQIVRLSNAGGAEAILVAFARGYGQTMTEAFLNSGRGRRPVPGGEKVYTDWLTRG